MSSTPAMSTAVARMRPGTVCSQPSTGTSVNGLTSGRKAGVRLPTRISRPAKVPRRTAGMRQASATPAISRATASATGLAAGLVSPWSTVIAFLAPFARN